MGLTYKIYYEEDFLDELENISRTKHAEIMKTIKSKEKILTQFPRIYQKVEFNDLQNGEYRRIVLDQYIVIYKIVSNKISFLKIYPQKTNYINQIEKFR